MTTNRQHEWEPTLRALDSEVSARRLGEPGDDVSALLAALHGPEHRAWEQALCDRLLPVVHEIGEAYLYGDATRRDELRVMLGSFEHLGPYALKDVADKLDAYLETGDTRTLDRALALLAALDDIVDMREALRILQPFTHQAAQRGYTLEGALRRAATWCRDDDGPWSAKTTLLELVDEDDENDENDENDEAWALRMERETSSDE